MATSASLADSPTPTNHASSISKDDANTGLDTRLTSPQTAKPAADASAARRKQSKSKKTNTSSHSRQSSSTSRGRDFRVGNVGNNGMIYLRPIKRSSQAPTPNSSSGTVGRQTARTTSSDPEWRESILSGTATQLSRGPRDSVASASPPPAPRTPKDSACLPEHPPLSSVPKVPSKPSPSGGTFKVVIDRAQNEDTASSTPLYDVAIPHYRLGTPRFTGKGSAVLHSSINTGSSVANSTLNSERASEEQPKARTLHTQNASRTPERVRSASDHSSEPPDLTPDRQLEPERNAFSSDVLFPKDPQKGTVGSADVRVSRVSGQILAASIPQLIVHITSPFRLDYDLLSDFFLTFRLFMAPSDLATQLIHRLRASVGSGDGTSRIVRVRTFVALRHWILNYFVDDFVSDMHLRIQFCEMVNHLCRDVRDVNSQTVGDLRILGELKRCWKHTCALFWDVPMDATTDHMEQDIYPGGIIGSRALPQDQVDAINRELARTRDSSPVRAATRDGHSPTRVSTRGTLTGANFAFNQTSALQSSSSVNRQGKKSSKSSSDRNSMQVMSCTLPVTNKLARQPSKGPRPVNTNSTARAQSKKSQQAGDNPRRPHKRSGSFSDALRDDRAPLPAPQGSEIGQNQPMQVMMPGSLIRGALVGPAAPYVESVMPHTPVGPLLERSVQARPPETGIVMSQERHGHFHPPNVRRFIGSVRRALSVKHYTTRPLSSNLEARNRSCSSIDSHGPFIATPFNEPGVPRRKLVGGQTVLRVDLLAAEIAEAYTDAVREAADVQPRTAQSLLSEFRPPPIDPLPGDPTAGNDNMLSLPNAHGKINSGVTMGSRSIIIADDTNGQMTPRPDVLNFESSLTRGTSGAQEVPIILDTTAATAQEVYIDGDGNTIPQELVHSPDRVEIRASQLSNANNLHDVTAVSLLERGKVLDDTYEDTGSFSDNTSANDPFQFDRSPFQQLRRMPGGDLRAAHHVHSLDHQQLLQSAAVNPSSAAGHHTLGTGSTSQQRKPDTGSQPAPHRSFEEEVAKLADLPDAGEEGGIESALRALEGRAPTPDATAGAEHMSVMSAQLQAQDAASSARHNRSKSKAHRDEEIIELPIGIEPSAPRTLQNLGHRTIQAGQPAGSDQAAVVLQSKPRPVSESEASQSSIPLLERGVNSQPPLRKDTDPSPELEISAKHSPEEDEAALHPHRHGSSRPSTQTHQSFLLDEDQSLSSLSTTTGDDATDDLRPSSGMRSFYDPEDEDVPGGITPRALLARPENPLARSSAAGGQWHERSQSEGDQPHPQHPSASKSKSVNDLLQTAQPAPLSTTPGAAHMCFVLAYDSQLLAQQFTVVERDALCEVEWRDLIDLRWNQAAAAHSNWVDFLRSKSQEANGYEFRAGVDMCIARFNLVVRWAKSEIVLTEDINERAATIIKYIHIAQHCRRLHNWATMYQLTMALVGSDISRLKTTWDLVPGKDRQVLAELEELIMPTKNFHNLREEIECATETFAQDGSGGCIPFIGIYTHDLIYNAQKPMYVPTEPVSNTLPSGLPQALVNFERHHTAATIVKNLLRLIEASCKYQFQPLPEVAARCVWISALSDDDVSAKSLQIEPALPRPLL